MSKQKKLDIIYEDKNLLVINKPAHMLCIKTEKSSNTLYEEASRYVKKQYPKNKVFIVNRLDKDTSGIVLFAKQKEIKEELQRSWQDFKREYLVIVSGNLKDKSGVLVNYLEEDKTLRVHCSNKGKKAITEYVVLDSNKSYSLLKVNIKTGRKHQIRVQFSNIGHCIVGDKIYGNGKNPLGRMGLCASKLTMNYRGREYVFKVNVPKEFKLMFKDKIEKYEEE